MTSLNASASTDTGYESDRQLAEYAEFHFGDMVYGVPNFPKALAELAFAHMQDRPRRRALDLGCAVGRASFELARQFDSVDGVDFSHNFIRMATSMVDTGAVHYARVEEGDLVSDHTRTLESLGLSDSARKVGFYQGDACNLDTRFSDYDLVLAANLIDRLYRPRLFLDSMPARIREGGLLIIASPYTWMEEHTPKEEWIGGYWKDGRRYTTLDGLQNHLGGHFRLIDPPRKVPFVIRETQHKCQHSLSEVTVWERLPGPETDGQPAE
ncbi:MAG TPA: putative 4-mercaptohistidine N1-methyltransferase [Marinobacter sp.]|jgi:putative 4-mercaptohistidine N1-methyltranferase|nr:putative 4-mercaptohistidine N1-methyltransferase [Marinobacter sp.]